MQCRRSHRLLAGALLTTSPIAAQAQKAPDPSLEIIVASTGMSKGIAQTTGAQWLARGELTLGHFYVGSYAKNVDSGTSKGEAAALAGVRTKVAGFDFNLSAAWKRALSAAPGSDKNALEVSGSVARKMGALTPRLSAIWSPDDLGKTGRTLFMEAGASYAVARTVAASGAIGRRERTGGNDYTAWNAGLTWTASRYLLVDAHYYDTDAGDAQPFRPRAVVSARVKF